MTVVDRYYTKKGVRWYCICDCGQIKLVRPTDLIRGDVKSCGCRRKETQRENLAQYRQAAAAVDLKNAMRGWNK